MCRCVYNCLLLLVFLAVSESAVHSRVKRQFSALSEESINSLVDELLKNVKEDNNSLVDPIAVPDAYLEDLDLQLYDGVAYGLSSIRRIGNAVLQNRTDGYYMKIQIGLNNIVALYNWRSNVTIQVPFLDIFSPPSRMFRNLVLFRERAKGEVLMRTEDVIIYTEIQVTQRGKGIKPRVVDFQILDMVGIDVDIRGFGVDLIDAIVSDMVSAASNIFKDIVYEQVEGPVRKAINEELVNLKLPFG